MAGLFSGSQSGCRHATRRSDRRKTTVRQVNGENGKGERRDFPEDIMCFGKEDPGGMALKERKMRGRVKERREREESDVGQCHDKRVRNAITAYFTASP